MEDDIRAARDWARLLFYRLSEILGDSDESDAYSRAAPELLSATQRTCGAYDKLFEKAATLKGIGAEVRS
jgi:hypothetical protein